MRHRTFRYKQDHFLNRRLELFYLLLINHFDRKQGLKCRIPNSCFSFLNSNSKLFLKPLQYVQNVIEFCCINVRMSEAWSFSKV